MDDADHAQDLANREADRILADCRARNAAAAPGDRPALRVCIDCSHEIEPARLAVAPNAIRCTACQSDAEGRFRTPYRVPGAAA